jgi:hypothetical protein
MTIVEAVTIAKIATTAAAVEAMALVVAVTYTSAEWLTIIAAVTGMITIVGGVIVNIVVAWRTNAAVTDAKTKLLANQTEMLATTKTIEGHVNSAATKAGEEITALRGELTRIRAELADKKEIAALLAQAAASKQPPDSKTRKDDEPTP